MNRFDRIPKSRKAEFVAWPVLRLFLVTRVEDESKIGKLEHNRNREETREANGKGMEKKRVEKKLGLLSRFKNRVAVAQRWVRRFKLE